MVRFPFPCHLLFLFCGWLSSRLAATSMVAVSMGPRLAGRRLADRRLAVDECRVSSGPISKALQS